MNTTNKLTEGPILKNFLWFIIPIIITGFLQQFYNAADTMIVGKFDGGTALAAVGSTSSLINLIITFFNGLSIGTNVLCAKLFGAGDTKGINRSLHTSILLGIILGVPLMAVGIFGSRYFLNLMGTPDNVIESSVLYMKIYFIGVPTTLIYNFAASILRASGDTKRPLIILAVSGILNIILNIICVVGLGWGVAGVAIGTVASQIASAILILMIFVRNESGYRLKFSHLRLYGKELKDILSVGVPTGINGILFSLSNVFIQSAINSFGKDTMAAHSIAWNYMCFSFLIVTAGEQGIVCFVGQNIGAKKYQRLPKVVNIGVITTAILTIIFTTFVIWQGRPLLGIFTNDPNIVEIGMVQLYTAISVYVLYVAGVAYGGALRGMGKSMLPTAINIIGICVVRVGWITLIWPLNPTLEMVYYSFPVTWIASGIPMWIAYMAVKRKFLKNHKNEV